MYKLTTRTFAWLLTLAVLFAGPTSAQGVGPAARPVGAPLLHLEPCEVKGVEGTLRCGTLDVFEDRTARIGRMIPLHVVVLSATAESPSLDPLFVLAGGPGQSAVSEARGMVRDLAGVRERRDIVLVDLRGTGMSNALRCEPTTPQAKLGFLGWGLPDELVEECLRGLDADPTLYTTPVLMDDLDDVRAALGYEQINLYGTSYGTRAALVYARRHPDRVRSLVLRSVTPLGAPVPLLPAQYGQAALASRFAECAADEECRARFPEPADDLEAALERLSTEPAHASYIDPTSGDTTPVRITREIFAGGVQFALYAPRSAKRLPEVIHAAASGDFAPFLQLATPMAEMLPRSINLGLFFSVTCAEDAPVVRQMDDAAIADATAGTFLGRTAVDGHARVCSVWPRGSVPEAFHEPVSSDVPTLLISGEMDPITPPSLAEAAMNYLPNSHHIIVPGAGHSPKSECMERLIRKFLEVGSAQALDESCPSDRGAQR